MIVIIMIIRIMTMIRRILQDSDVKKWECNMMVQQKPHRKKLICSKKGLYVRKLARIVRNNFTLEQTMFERKRFSPSWVGTQGG